MIGIAADLRDQPCKASVRNRTLDHVARPAAHGPAATASIQPGDIVLSLNGTLVESQEQVTALEAKAGKEIAVLIGRTSLQRISGEVHAAGLLLERN